MSAELAIAFMDVSTRGFDVQGNSLQFDTTALAGIDRQSFKVPEPGVFTCVLPVTPAVANRYGTLHGGCIATLIDVVGSAALISVSPRGGVSLNINTNYLSKAPIGSRVLIEATLLRLGKTIATIDVQIKGEASGELIAQGTHVKFISITEPTMEELVEQLRKACSSSPGEEQQEGSPPQQRRGGPRSRL